MAKGKGMDTTWQGTRTMRGASSGWAPQCGLTTCVRQSLVLLQVNAVGLAAMLAFLVTLLWCAAAALWLGVAHPLPWGPDWAALGTGGHSAPGGDNDSGSTSGGGSRLPHSLLVALSVVSALSVQLTAVACQQNVHPLLSELQVG